jgi:hypothetical protein
VILSLLGYFYLLSIVDNGILLSHFLFPFSDQIIVIGRSRSDDQCTFLRSGCTTNHSLNRFQFSFDIKMRH